jgi:hypothetical protein
MLCKSGLWRLWHHKLVNSALNSNVRVGSKPEVVTPAPHVRPTLKSGHREATRHIRKVPSAVISAYHFTCSGSTDVRDFVHIAECVDRAVLALTRKFDSTLIRQ